MSERSMQRIATDGRPSRGNIVAALVAMGLTTLLASGTERTMPWRVASQISTVVSLATALLVILIQPVGWLRGIVGGAFLLSLLTSRRFVTKAASGKPKSGPFRKSNSRGE